MFLSAGLTHYLTQVGSMRQALNHGILCFYYGPVPASASVAMAASNGLVCAITNSGLPYVFGRSAWGQVTLAGGTASVSTVSSVKVGGVELLASPITFTSTLTDLNMRVAAYLNSVRHRCPWPLRWYQNGAQLLVATYSHAGVIPTAYGPGESGPTLAVVYSGGTASVTSTSDIGSLLNGTASQNGLLFSATPDPTYTHLVKRPSQAWMGLVLTTTAPTFFRFYNCEGTDTDPSGTLSLRPWNCEYLYNNPTTTPGARAVLLQGTVGGLGRGYDYEFDITIGFGRVNRYHTVDTFVVTIEG